MTLSIYDRIYDSTIRHGLYQKLTYTILGLAALSDEAEIITLSIILPVITREWGLSPQQQEVLGSVLFAGIFLGSIIIGFIADKIGRRKALLFSLCFQFIFAITAPLIQNYLVFLIVRSALGIMIGCTIPVVVSYITEISTSDYRGKSQVFIQVFFVFGMIYATIMSLIFMESFDNGNWRGLLLAGALPSLLVLIGTICFVKESPRFLFTAGKFQEAIQCLEKIATINNEYRNVTLNQQEKEELLYWQQENLNKKEKKSTVKKLFKINNLLKTFPLLISWFGLSFNFFGMIFVLPFILGNNNEQLETKDPSGIFKYFLILFGELPALFIAYKIIDHKSFGRKNSTILGHLLATLAFITGYFCQGNALIASLILARLGTKLSFITINPLTSELYKTNYRTLALGFTSGFGRIGAVIMPMITLKLFAKDPQAPLLAFGIVSIIMAIALCFIPYEPLGRKLDESDFEEDIMKEKVREIESRLI